MINNELTDTATTRHSICPSTEEPQREVPVSTQEGVDHAVSAGKSVFEIYGVMGLARGIPKIRLKEEKVIDDADVGGFIVCLPLPFSTDLRAFWRTATVSYVPVGVVVGPPNQTCLHMEDIAISALKLT